MRYTLKDFYSIDGMYYFPELNGVWMDKDEAQQILDKMNEDLVWYDQQAQQDAAMEDYNFGL